MYKLERNVRNWAVCQWNGIPAQDCVNPTQHFTIFSHVASNNTNNNSFLQCSFLLNVLSFPLYRFACLVCKHCPVFDTVAVLSIHRQGKKHLSSKLIKIQRIYQISWADIKFDFLVSHWTVRWSHSWANLNCHCLLCLGTGSLRGRVWKKIC